MITRILLQASGLAQRPFHHRYTTWGWFVDYSRGLKALATFTPPLLGEAG